MSGVLAMAGKTRAAVTIDVQAADYSTLSTGGLAATSVSFNSDGTVTVVADEGGGYTFRTGGSGSDYQIYFQTNSGSLSSGTANAWLTLGSNQTIGVTRPINGTKLWTGTVIVRRASDGVEMDRANISLSATYEVEGGGGGGGGGVDP